jgi:nucleoside-diphosphate-sugar epimerase
MLSNRRIFLTGGTGFVGRTLLDHVAARGDDSTRVTVLSRDPQRFVRLYPHYGRLPWLEFRRGDLAGQAAMAGNFTDVIHAAADTHGVSDEAQWIDQIVNGTRAMLDLAVRTGARRFLMVSSGAVYGPQPPDLDAIEENFSGAPPIAALSSTYGQAKRVAEQLCTIYYRRHGLETLTARCFAFVGRHIPPRGPYAIGNFIADALDPAQPAIRVNGDGKAVRTYLDGEDLARWLFFILTDGEAGEAYNVGSSQPICMADLATLVATLLAPNKPVEIRGTGQPDSARSIYVPSIRKIAALGAVQQWSLEEAILRAAAAMTVR